MEESVISSKDASASASASSAFASHLQPVLVSIGPYYHGNQRLESIKERKENIKRYRLFNYQTVCKNIIAAYLSGKPFHLKLPQIKSFYTELDRDSKLGVEINDRFIQMMVDDGIFILNFMHMGDKIFDETTRWKLQSDMLLHHNQLPFFVLEDLFNLMNKKLWHLSYRSVVELAITSFANLLPACFNSSAFRGAEFHDLRHLFYSCAHSLRNNLPHIDVISRIPDAILISNTSDYYPYTVPIGPYHYRQMKPEIRTDDKQKKLEIRTDDKQKKLEIRTDDKQKKLEIGTDDKQSYVEKFRINRVVNLKDLRQHLQEWWRMTNISSSYRYYSKNAMKGMQEKEVMEMFVQDSCFVMELMLGKQDKEAAENNPILRHPQTLALVKLDLLLFENQLPYQVLQTLFNLIRDRPADCPSLEHLAIDFFADLLTPEWKTAGSSTEGFYLHLLHLFHSCATAQPIAEQRSRFKIFFDDDPKYLPLEVSVHSQGQEQVFIPSASDLADATSIKFKSLTDGSLFKMSFHQGTMELSPLLLTNSTICLYCNLIAFEQSLFPIVKTPVTNYMIILGCLIKSARDLELLDRNNIVKCAISNKQACLFFEQVDKLISSEYRQTSSSNSSLQLVSLVNNFHNVAIKRRRLTRGIHVLLLAGLVLLLCLVAPQLEAVAPNKAVLQSVFIPILTMATIFSTHKFLKGKTSELRLAIHPSPTKSGLTKSGPFLPNPTRARSSPARPSLPVFTEPDPTLTKSGPTKSGPLLTRRRA